MSTIPLLLESIGVGRAEKFWLGENNWQKQRAFPAIRRGLRANRT
jgi:hypothetical protein